MTKDSDRLLHEIAEAFEAAESKLQGRRTQATHIVFAMPLLNGALVPSMMESLPFNSADSEQMSWAIGHAVCHAMNNARKYGISFDDIENTILISFEPVKS
jgi:hypothetical protein